MTFTTDQKAALAAKLSPADVKGRKQGGATVNYIEGWHAIAEANRIFGFDGWLRETVYCHEVCRYEVTIGDAKASGWKVGYEAKVRVTIGGVTREGTGHGSGIARDLFDAIESAAKESETDAMKRALMTFGNPFGLALYDKSRVNVGYEQPETAAPAKPRLVESEIDTSAADEAWLLTALAKAEDEDRFNTLLAHKNWKGRYARLPAGPKATVDKALAAKRYSLGIHDEADRLVQIVGAG